jgi:ligand-binding SRPBCC domain-containing protein
MAQPKPIVTRIEERVRTSRSRREVFAFLDRPSNIKRVTPTTMAVSLESHPDDLRLGTIFAYRLKRWPLELVWDVVVSEYVPPKGFTNVKARGFFPKWAHKHEIVAEDDGGTVLRVSLEYEVPPGLYNSLSNSYVIRDAMAELVREQTRAIGEALENDDYPNA